MTKPDPTCDLFAERIALGEPLGDLADHPARCERCRRLAALPVELAVTHREIDPGIGFAARVTAGTQHRLAVRRRRRIATGLAATAAVAALAVVVVMRVSATPVVAVTPVREPVRPATELHQPDPVASHDGLDEDVKGLVHLANVERSARVSARWGRIEKSLAPYRSLLKGNTP